MMFTVRGMMLVPFFVDRSVVGQTEPTVLMATTFTPNMIATACLHGRSAATRALLSSLFEVFRSSKLSRLLGCLPLRRFLGT